MVGLRSALWHWLVGHEVKVSMTHISRSSDFAYILKTIWCMYIILWDYESVWPDMCPQNKCRSLCHIFHGPVILPYILKTFLCMNILLRDYESLWPGVWPKNKCRSLTYISWSSDFALYFEDYLIYEHHTLALWVSLTCNSSYFLFLMLDDGWVVSNSGWWMGVF